MALPYTEALVNLMMFALLMHVKNPKEREALNRVFGSGEWQNADFVASSGRTREKGFTDYFVSKVGARHALPLPLPFSPEDAVAGRRWRTKFSLVHFSNHSLAAILMKDVMVKAWKEAERLRLTTPGDEGEQLRLPEEEAGPKALWEALAARFRGQTMSCEDVIVRTLDAWPFLEKDYHDLLLEMERQGKVVIRRVKSKKFGLQRGDSVTFT